LTKFLTAGKDRYIVSMVKTHRAAGAQSCGAARGAMIFDATSPTTIAATS
jgi:hypothetical protein